MRVGAGLFDGHGGKVEIATEKTYVLLEHHDEEE